MESTIEQPAEEKPEIVDDPVEVANPIKVEEPAQSQNEVLLDDIDVAYIKNNQLKVGRQADDPNIKLINLVKGHPCIYDRDHPKYSDSNYKYECWDKIASTLKKKRGECKRKFLTLYQKFGNTYMMIRKPELVKQGFPKKKFVYHEEMMFLKEHLELSLIEKRVKTIVTSCRRNERDAAKQKAKAAKALKEQEQKKDEKSKMPVMQKKPQFSNPKPDFYRRPPDNRPYYDMDEDFSRSNMPMPGPSTPQFFQTISTIATTHPGFPGPGLVMPQLPFRQHDYPDNRPPALNNRDNRRNDRVTSDSHVDFFFKSVAQQVKKSNISDKNFLELQSTILSALAYKLSFYERQ